jgi:hypothetical protein
MKWGDLMDERTYAQVYGPEREPWEARVNTVIYVDPDTLVRDAARAYKANGLRPIPVFGVRDQRCLCGQLHQDRGEGKHPKHPSWADSSFPYRSADFGPKDNIALAMGKQPDGRWLVGLDYDFGAGRDVLLSLPPVLAMSYLPETLTTRTPHGRHLIFEVPADTYLGNWTDILHTKREQGYALDVKYARGALVSGPSWHRDGKQYQTEIRPIAKLPMHTLAFLLMLRDRSGWSSWTANNPGKKP